MYVIYNQMTNQYAAEGCTGEHDGKFTNDLQEAMLYYSWSEASDASQNFGGDLEVKGLD